MKNKSFKSNHYKHAAAPADTEPDEHSQINGYLPGVENLNNIQQLLGSDTVFSDAQQRRERNATLMSDFTQLTNQLRSSGENVSVGQGIQLTHAMAQCLGLLSTLVSYAELSQTCVDSSQTMSVGGESHQTGSINKNDADDLLRGPENPSVWTPAYNQRLIDAIAAFTQRFAGVITEVRERSEVRIAEMVADGVRIAGLGLLSDLTEGLLPPKGPQNEAEERQQIYNHAAGGRLAKSANDKSAPIKTKSENDTEMPNGGDAVCLFDVAQLLATPGADVNIMLRSNDVVV